MQIDLESSLIFPHFLFVCKSVQWGIETRAIADALKSGIGVLKSLDLTTNDIGAEGAKALAAALSDGRAGLNKLDLQVNRLEEGKQLVRDAVKGRDGFELKL